MDVMKIADFNVELVHVTPEAEKHMGYCARVSNPQNQDNPEVAKLLKHCIEHGHWSVFEMASLCLEITTSRAISAQILRHRSFSFQEFSQRYASPSEFIAYPPRRQDVKNRQGSIDDLSVETHEWFKGQQDWTWTNARLRYEEAIKRGIAKECARFLLPMNTQTKLYMHGTVRSWIHYLKMRTDPSTQKEHRQIAVAAQLYFVGCFPRVSEALGWGIE